MSIENKIYIEYLSFEINIYFQRNFEAEMEGWPNLLVEMSQKSFRSY